ncbi:YecA family protein [Brevibacillus sp. 179-C9.3 HS]|uniref:YecA family protein n=1 Tax=unclassified Brevibacillus TaxID=2684853 RepID=UPI0039A339C1
MDISAIKNYLHAFRGTVLKKDILDHLKSLKANEVSQNNQSTAKEIWCLEQVYMVIQKYLSAFRNLQEKKYYNAWREFDLADIGISSLKRHLDFQENQYHLQFYDRMIYQFQKLFPYRYFMSREMVVKKASCSICGETISIRNPCGHRVGEIYNGEACGRSIQEAELLGIAIVTNPFDKYTVLFPQGKQYNYSMLDNLISQISEPYADWDLDIVKERKQEFIGVGRNKPCPCDSGKKYKFCCLGSKNELFDHYRITVHRETPGKIIPLHTVHTWK